VKVLILVCLMAWAGNAFAQETGWVVRPSGTAVIRGRVVAAADGRPLPGAGLILKPQSDGWRWEVTDGRGVFEFSGLPSGTYTLSASLPGLLTSSHGQRRPSDAPAPIVLKDGQVKSGIEIALPIGGVIEVHVRDESGVPVEGAYVQAQLPRPSSNGELVLAPNMGDKQHNFATDDRGVLRLYDLGPGGYYVSASPPVVLGQPNDLEHQKATGRLQTFHPGVVSLADAEPLVLGLGEERRIDIVIARPYAAARREPQGAITVRAFDSMGNPWVGGEVRPLEVTGEGAARILTRARTTATSSPRFWEKKDFYTDDHGEVRIHGLPPADYVVAIGGIFFPGSHSRADAHVLAIRPWDDVNLDIVLPPITPARITGRVVRWDEQPGRTFVVLSRNPAGPLYPQSLITDAMFRSELVDGEFHFDDIGPGDYILRTSYDPDSDVRDGVAELPVTVEGRDISDLILTTAPPVEVRAHSVQWRCELRRTATGFERPSCRQ
jgi:hypothetical protein